MSILEHTLILNCAIATGASMDEVVLFFIFLQCVYLIFPSDQFPDYLLLDHQPNYYIPWNIYDPVEAD